MCTQEAVVSNEESAALLAFESRNLLVLVRPITAFDDLLGATEAALCRLNDLTVELDKVLRILFQSDGFMDLEGNHVFAGFRFAFLYSVLIVGACALILAVSVGDYVFAVSALASDLEGVSFDLAYGGGLCHYSEGTQFSQVLRHYASR